MQRRNSLEPPAYDTLYGLNPSYSTLPPEYVPAPDHDERSTTNSSVDELVAPTLHNHRGDAHSNIPRTTQDVDSMCSVRTSARTSTSTSTTTTSTPPQRPERSSFGSSYYEPRPTPKAQPPPSSSSTHTPSVKIPTSFRAKYRAALAEDRHRRDTRVQYISGTEAQRITGNASRRREENRRIGRRASFGDADFSRDAGDDEMLTLEQQREGRRRRGKDGGSLGLTFFAF